MLPLIHQMKKQLLFFITLALFTSCNFKQEVKEVPSPVLLPEIEEHSISNAMSFFDSDSIYKQSFQTESTFNGKILTWKTKVFDNGALQATLTDSLPGMSYLVDAADLNNDGVGELIIVSSESMNCNIFCYTKTKEGWVGKHVPAYTVKDLPQGYYWDELVAVKKNTIIRTCIIYNDRKEEINKQLLVTYGLDKNAEIIVLKEKEKHQKR